MHRLFTRLEIVRIDLSLLHCCDAVPAALLPPIQAFHILRITLLLRHVMPDIRVSVHQFKKKTPAHPKLHRPHLRSSHLDLLALDTLPLKADSTQNAQH
jgi:hypothetical protein